MHRPSLPVGSTPAASASPVDRSIEPRRERNAKITRARILDAAEREFATRGFAGARLRDIADAAQVQPALIHHYFADKHGLYRAVLDRALLPTSTESWTLLSSRHDLQGLLAGFVDLLIRFHAAHENLLLILRHEALTGSTVLAEVCRERTLPIVEAVTAFLEQCQRAGEVRADLSPAEIIAATISLVVYPFTEAGMLAAVLPDAVACNEAALQRRKQAIVALLLAGIRPQLAFPVVR
jgi:TetR/AcrR family transcriptional regulator